MNSRRFMFAPKGHPKEGIVKVQNAILKGLKPALALQHEMRADVRCGSFADIAGPLGHVGFTPESRHAPNAPSMSAWCQ
jgi:hypothetical protein